MGMSCGAFKFQGNSGSITCVSNVKKGNPVLVSMQRGEPVVRVFVGFASYTFAAPSQNSQIAPGHYDLFRVSWKVHLLSGCRLHIFQTLLFTHPLTQVNKERPFKAHNICAYSSQEQIITKVILLRSQNDNSTQFFRKEFVQNKAYLQISLWNPILHEKFRSGTKKVSFSLSRICHRSYVYPTVSNIYGKFVLLWFSRCTPHTPRNKIYGSNFNNPSRLTDYWNIYRVRKYRKDLKLFF